VYVVAASHGKEYGNIKTQKRAQDFARAKKRTDICHPYLHYPGANMQDFGQQHCCANFLLLYDQGKNGEKKS
jgi:hypothetical protein